MRIKKGKEEEKKKKEKTEIKQKSEKLNAICLCNTISKGEHITVELEEEGKMCY